MGNTKSDYKKPEQPKLLEVKISTNNSPEAAAANRTASGDAETNLNTAIREVRAQHDDARKRLGDVRKAGDKAKKHHSIKDDIVNFVTFSTGIDPKVVDAAIRKLEELVNKFLDFVKQALDEATPIISMAKRAFDWLKDVQEPALNLKSGMEGGDATGIANWEGPAKDTYYQRQPLQIAALADYGNAGATIGTWLIELVNANVDFIMAMFQPVVDIIADIATIAVGAATVAGFLDALNKAYELVGKAITSAYSQLQAIVTNTMETVNKKFESVKLLGELGKDWPQMVTINTATHAGHTHKPLPSNG